MNDFSLAYEGFEPAEEAHMDVMSGTLDLVQRSYAGTHIRDGMLCFGPHLPKELDELSFSMKFQGTPLRVALAQGRLTVVADREGVSRPIKVAIGDDVRELCPGDQEIFQRRLQTSTEHQGSG
jgi:trehalose/maltose hydrolase-like predicted phosphorylase